MAKKRRKHKNQIKKDRIQIWLENMHGYKFGRSRLAYVDLAFLGEKILKIAPPRPGEPYSGPKGRFDTIYRLVAKLPALKPPNSAKPDRIKKFYRSAEWARARYDALAKNGGCCELCGRSKDDGIVLHVDHIKPLRKYWSLRLDTDNHQVLCNTCNWGKGNRDETDWRPQPDYSEPQLATLMGEKI